MISKIRSTEFLFGPISRDLFRFFGRSLHDDGKGCAHIGGTQNFTKVFGESKRIDVFDFSILRVSSVHSASSLGRGDVTPISGLITCSLKFLSVHVGFNQSRLYGVPGIPIVLDSVDDPAEYIRGKVWNLRHEEKPAVADDLGEVFLSRFFTPADPSVSGCDSPCRTAECEASEPPAGGTLDEISDLSPAKRTNAQVMVFLHERVPCTRSASISDFNGDQLYLSQLFQSAGNLVEPFGNIGLLLRVLPYEEVFTRTLRQWNQTLSMQSEQGGTTTHILNATIGRTPIEPTTNQTGKSSGGRSPVLVLPW